MEALDPIVQRVIAFYPQRVTGARTIQSGGPKVVWRLESDQGPLCLKRLRHPEERAAFSVPAQVHIARSGGPVPAVLPTRDGSLWVQVDGAVFVLYQWIEGRNARFSPAGDLVAAVEGLAAFHKASRGYRPPEGCRVSSKLGGLPAHYQSLRQRLEDWKGMAADQPGDPFHAAYLSGVDQEIERALAAEEALQRSPYAQMVERALPGDTLCHQDYGEGNALVASGRVLVLDLDNVTFDFPSRDLRKLLNKQMLDRGRWDETLAVTVLDAYARVHPLTGADLELLAIDLLFPHPFHDAAKNHFKKGKREHPSRLLDVLPLEREKAAVLAHWPPSGRRS